VYEPVTASQVSHEDEANVAYAGVAASCDRSTAENGSSDGRSLAGSRPA